MRVSFALLGLLAAAHLTFAQGTLVFDQQSSDESHILEGGFWLSQLPRPVQSFTPSLDAVGFVRFFVVIPDSVSGIAVNLRSGSPSGPLIGSTAPLNQGSPYSGTLTLYFSTPVEVTPGATYFLQPVVSSGDMGFNSSQFYGYSGGELFSGGTPVSPSSDMFFREGIVIPEPTSAGLMVAGLVLFGWSRFRMYRAPTAAGT